jgi:hypothetical protein
LSVTTSGGGGAGNDVAHLRAGHFLVVRSLLRILPHAAAAKAALDAVIDECAAMQNLRSVIVRYRANMMSEPREDKRAKILSVCAVRGYRGANPLLCGFTP